MYKLMYTIKMVSYIHKLHSIFKQYHIFLKLISPSSFIHPQIVLEASHELSEMLIALNFQAASFAFSSLQQISSQARMHVRVTNSSKTTFAPE